jgi:uncharacterized protein YoxC
MALLWLLQPLADQLDRIEKSLLSLHEKTTTLDRKADKLMAQVQVSQEALDEFAQSVSDIADELGSDIDVLVAAAKAGEPLPQANLDSLSAAKQKLQALDQPDVEPLPEP